MSALRVGQMIQSVDVKAGGTSTAFLGTLAALRTLEGVSIRAYATPPATDDPAAADIAAHPDEWTTVAGYGRALAAGPFGRSVIADIRARAIDVLHIHGLWSPDLLAAGLACLDAGVPYVWEPHGMLVREAYAQKRWKKDLFMALGMRRALTGAAGLVFVTADEREHSLIPAGVAMNRRHVIPLPVAMPPMEITQEFRDSSRGRFGLPLGAPVVVFMGRFHPVKRIDMAMRALAACGVKDARILLVGGGELEPSLRGLAKELGIESRVVFAGWVQGDDKWRALAAGDVLTLNSIHENFGYVAVEALAVGTMPVLTSNLAMAEELRAAGVTPAPGSDERALGEALATALSRRDWKATLGRGGAWVREQLSAGTIGQRLNALYASVVSRPSEVGA